MIALLKKLIERRKEKVSLILLDDDNPHRQDHYSLNPGKLFWLVGGVQLLFILIILFILYITPLGSVVFNQEHRAIRSSVIEVRDRIAALQDSLEVRDQQLYEIQRVIREGTDTTFEITSAADQRMLYDEEQREPTHSPDPGQARMTFQAYDQPASFSLTGSQIVDSEVFSGNILFPVESPVSGSRTNDYNPEKGHYGIDIAARVGADVRNVADGVVITSDWTINNGYVMHIHHGDGLITVYKHFSEVFYHSGDVVRKGDIIGKVGETGLLASGPHIHFEIWKNGASLDPALYIH